jgi:hypothetical protein
MALKLPKLPKIKKPKLPKLKAPKLPKIKGPKLPTKAGVTAGVAAGITSLKLETTVPLLFAVPLALMIFFIYRFGTGTKLWQVAALTIITLISGYGLWIAISNDPSLMEGMTIIMIGLLIASIAVGSYMIYQAMNDTFKKEEEKTAT